MGQKEIIEFKLDKLEWKPVKFGDVAIQQRKVVDRKNTSLTKYIKGEHMGSEDLHVREWGELEDEYLGPAFIRKFEKGDVLYGSRRTYLRKVAVAHFDGITANTTFVIKANENKIDKRLLPFVMLSENFAEHSIKNSKGSVNPYINWKDIANYEFLLPPKDQQAKLAELLWALDEVMEREREVLEGLEMARQSFFSEKIKKYSGKKTPLSKLLIPKKKKSQVPHKRDKYIGLEHIESGKFECKNFGNSSEVLAQCNIIDTGDLCYSKLRPYLDKAFIADFDAVSTTEILVFDTKIVSKEYILNYMHSKPFIDFVNGKTFGTRMPRASLEIIGEFEIKVFEEEDNFLQELKMFNKNIHNVHDKIMDSKGLQKSLIHQIF